MSVAKGIEIELDDGARMLLRPITREDGQLLQQGLEQMSERSRYLRFLSPLKTLSRTLLDELTNADGDQRISWGALDLACEPPCPVGAAGAVRLAPNSTEAELSVVVIDSHQHRGLACMLLGAVGYHAARVGMTKFVGDVLSENRPVRQLLTELGASVTYGQFGTVHFELPVYSNLAEYPEFPGSSVIEKVYDALDRA